jgi:hypothetical protein
MKAATIAKQLDANKIVVYKIRRLRGYLWGWGLLVFQPSDWNITNRVGNIQRQLTNFRLDEKPYEKPTWHVFDTIEQMNQWQNNL